MIVSMIAGGSSREREVSLCSGKCLARALRKRSHAVTEIDVDADLISRLLGDEGSAAIPVLHGELDEGGALREVLWMLGVPFVGDDGVSSRRTLNKSVTTRLVGATGLAAPQQAALSDGIFRELGAQTMMSALGERIGFPLMMKPTRSGSVLRMVKVGSMNDLPVVLVETFAYGKGVVAEELVEGMELFVTIFEGGTDPRTLPPVKTRPASGVYGYKFRYTVGTTHLLTPGELPDGVFEVVGDLMVRTHRALGHRDIPRTDIIVREGVPVFLESDVAPGLTDTSLTPLALEAADLDIGEVLSVFAERARHRGH